MRTRHENVIEMGTIITSATEIFFFCTTANGFRFPHRRAHRTGVTSVAATAAAATAAAAAAAAAATAATAAGIAATVTSHGARTKRKRGGLSLKKENMRTIT